MDLNEDKQYDAIVEAIEKVMTYHMGNAESTYGHEWFYEAVRQGAKEAIEKAIQNGDLKIGDQK